MNKLETALPYAQHAAESYSGWGLHVYAVCLTEMGRYAEAEARCRRRTRSGIRIILPGIAGVRRRAKGRSESGASNVDGHGARFRIIERVR